VPSSFLEADLKRDEGNRLTSYVDTEGNWTIGIGHKLGTSRKFCGLTWTQAQVDDQFQKDLAAATEGIETALPWFSDLEPLRQDCLINMAFNLGVHGLLSFVQFLSFCHQGEWAQAVADVKRTPWYSQAKGRAVRICEQLLTNVHQE
jgi:lysozyme